MAKRLAARVQESVVLRRLVSIYLLGKNGHHPNDSYQTINQNVRAVCLLSQAVFLLSTRSSPALECAGIFEELAESKLEYPVTRRLNQKPSWVIIKYVQNFCKCVDYVV